MLIQQTVIWFRDGTESLDDLTRSFHPLSHLLGRLLNEFYEGKKIEFINLYFHSDITFDLYPVIPINHIHVRSTNIAYFSSIDLVLLNNMKIEEQQFFLWDESYKSLIAITEKFKRENFKDAVEKAYEKGIQLRLNPDYEDLVTDIYLYGTKLTASILFYFTKDRVYSKFILRKNNNIIFQQELDGTIWGIPFFYEAYKKIMVKNDDIIIYVHQGMADQPIKIILSQQVVNSEKGL